MRKRVSDFFFWLAALLGIILWIVWDRIDEVLAEIEESHNG